MRTEFLEVDDNYLLEIESIIQWVESFNIKLNPNSRIMQYRKNIDSYNMNRNESNYKYKETIYEFLQLKTVYTLLRSMSGCEKYIAEKLNKVINGPAYLDKKNPESRNYFFEIYLASRYGKNLVLPKYDEDIRIQLNHIPVVFQCKRICSEKKSKFFSNIKKAERQVINVLNHDLSQLTKAIIAVDITPVVYNELILDRADVGFIQTQFEQCLSPYTEDIRKYLNERKCKKVVAILIRAALPYLRSKTEHITLVENVVFFEFSSSHNIAMKIRNHYQNLR